MSRLPNTFLLETFTENRSHLWFPSLIGKEESFLKLEATTELDRFQKRFISNATCFNLDFSIVLTNVKPKTVYSQIIHLLGAMIEG